MPYVRPDPSTVDHSQPSNTTKEKVIAFGIGLIEGISHPGNTTESWAAYHFEVHAQKCAYCHNPAEVYRNRDQLCDAGHRLAQEVTRYACNLSKLWLDMLTRVLASKFLYNKSDDCTCSTVEENGKPVRIEVAAAYLEVRSLLKAVERSLHSRSRPRRSFVSTDRTYYVAPCALSSSKTNPKRVKQDDVLERRSRPRSGEIID